MKVVIFSNAGCLLFNHMLEVNSANAVACFIGRIGLLVYPSLPFANIDNGAVYVVIIFEKHIGGLGLLA